MQHQLMIEERAHCSSGGHTITFGIEERRDCLDWVRYAVERFGPDTRILLVGISMGAATVLMAAGLPLPPQVRGIIADCPYSTPLAIIRKVGRDMHLPAGLFFSAYGDVRRPASGTFSDTHPVHYVQNHCIARPGLMLLSHSISS